MSDSIKVAIKVRPLIKREKDENLPIQWTVQENSIAPLDPELKKRIEGGFYFDHIFDMSTTNDQVFNIVAKPIVDAAVNGVNGTIFAYGQTSSGKTYTMMGTDENPGVIPLAVDCIFDAIANSYGREFLLRVSYIEIYKERINDLLDKNRTDLKIKEDMKTGQTIVVCKEEVVNSPATVLAMMKKGDGNRRTGETNMNERSSRSHTIFRITIESRASNDDSDGAVNVSQLNLVDLAGSERARQTGATGERFNEGIHINLSLSALGLVIMQLSECQENPQKYINFRDSKLTRILQTSLGGNAMTTIICAVTPAAAEETQCTLAFASRAKRVKNKPQVNEVVSDAALLKRYAKQMAKLKAELEKAKSADVVEMESKLMEKERANQILEERIEMLKNKIVCGSNTPDEESFNRRAKRRRTWGGSGTLPSKIPPLHKIIGLPTIKELDKTPEKIKKREHIKKRQSIIQSLDFTNQTFQTEFADFELELIESERGRDSNNRLSDGSNVGDEEFHISVRPRRNVQFEDDVAFIGSSFRSLETTPERKTTESPGGSEPPSPSTPKLVLRNRINFLMEEYNALRKDHRNLEEFAKLEKQMYVDEAVDKAMIEHNKMLAISEEKCREITEKYTKLESDSSASEKRLTELEQHLVESTNSLKALKLENQSLIDELNKLKITKPRGESQTSNSEKESSSIFANISYFEEMEVSDIQGDSVFNNETQNLDDLTASDNSIANLTLPRYDETKKSKELTNVAYSEFVKKIGEKSSDELTKVMQQLIDAKHSLEDENSKLQIMFKRKVREADEIKNDIRELKAGMVKLQETIHLLTIENTDLTSKLSIEKEHAKEAEKSLQSTIAELNSSINAITEEKKLLESSVKEFDSKKCSKSVTASDEEMQQLITKCQDTIASLTAENEELSSNLMSKIEELDRIKDFKAPPGEHECAYRELTINLSDRNKILEAENIELSNSLIDKIEEYDRVKEELENLKFKFSSPITVTESSKLIEISMNRTNLNEDENFNGESAESFKNNTEIDDFKLTHRTVDDLLRLSNDNDHSLRQSIGKSGKNGLDLLRMSFTTNRSIRNGNEWKSIESTNEIDESEFPGTTVDDLLQNSIVSSESHCENNEIDKQSEENVDEWKIKAEMLQEQVNNLNLLNNKLSELKITTCTQCAHLAELNENRKALKLEAKALNRKLRELQDKFDKECADSELLRTKANEDMNLSVCDFTLNGSAMLDGNLNVSFVEEKVQALHQELEALREKHDKLSDLYKEKCEEIDKLQDSCSRETTPTPTSTDSPRIKRSDVKLERIQTDMEKLRTDFLIFKKSINEISAGLQKFVNEKTMMQREIESLRAEKVVNSTETLESTKAEEKIAFLENEVTRLNKEICNSNLVTEELENVKNSLEAAVESLKAEKVAYELKIATKDTSYSPERMNILENEVKRLCEEIQSSNAVKQQLEDAKASLEAEVQSFKTEKATFDDETLGTVDLTTENIKFLENEVTRLSEEIRQSNADKEELKLAKSSLEAEVESLKIEKAPVDENAKKIDDTSMIEKIKFLEDTKTSLESKIETLQFEKMSIEEKSTKMEERMTFLENEVARLNEEIRISNSIKEELKNMKISLSAQVEFLKAAKSHEKNSTNVENRELENGESSANAEEEFSKMEKTSTDEFAGLENLSMTQTMKYLENEVSHLSEKINNSNVVKEELQNTKSFLEAEVQSLKAEKIAFDEKITQTEDTSAQERINILEKEVARLNEEIIHFNEVKEELESAKSTLEAEVQYLKAEKATTEAETSSVSKERIAVVRPELIRLIDENDGSNASNQQVESFESSFEAEIQNFKAEDKIHEESINDIGDSSNNNDENFAKIVESLQFKLKETNEDLKNYMEINEQLNNQLKTIKASEDEVNAAKSRLENEVSVLKDERMNYEKSLATLQESLNKLQRESTLSKLEDVEVSLKEKEKENTELKNKFNELERSEEETKLEATNLKAEIKYLEETLHNVHRTVTDLQETNSTLKSELEETKTRKAMDRQSEIEETSYETLKEYEKMVEELRIKVQDITNDLHVNSKETAELNDQLTKLNAAKDELNDARLALESEVKNLKYERDDLEVTVKNLRQTLNELEEKNWSLDLELQGMKSEKEKIDEIVRKNVENREFQDYEMTINTMNIRVEEMTVELKKYAEENEELNEKVVELQEIIKTANIEENKFVGYENLAKSSASRSEKYCNELESARESITKEIKSLKPTIKNHEFLDKSINELFALFVSTIMSKEQEIIKTLNDRFEAEKQKLEEQNRQSCDAEKRVTVWAKELEAEIERTQQDLIRREAKTMELNNEIAKLQNLLKESAHENQLLNEKMHVLEMDFNILQTELERNPDGKVSVTLNSTQERERLIQEAIDTREMEHSAKLRLVEKRNKEKFDELTKNLEYYKTKNLELTNNLEGLEANEKQLKSIADMKSNELLKSNNTIEILQEELQNITENYNQLMEQHSETARQVDEITCVLKIKCDKLSEYKTKLETITPEYEHLKDQATERQLRLEKYKSEIECMTAENEKAISSLKDRLDSEEIKSTSYCKQLTNFSNKNTILQTEIQELKRKCEELEGANEKLMKSMRNSTSRIRAEEEIEDLRDENRTLQRNLEGASNRITDLQEIKTQMLKELVDIRGKYEAICNENIEIKKTLNSHQARVNQTIELQEKYESLQQDKNRTALEFEGMKSKLLHVENKLKACAKENEDLKKVNKELDEEMEDMVSQIHELRKENAELDEKLYTITVASTESSGSIEAKTKKEINEETERSKAQIVELQSSIESLKLQRDLLSNELEDAKKSLESFKNENSELRIKVGLHLDRGDSLSCDSSRSGSPALESIRVDNRRRRSRTELFNQKRQLEIFEPNESACCDKCRCSVLRDEICKLERELVTKNGEIAAMEIRIQSENFPHMKRCKDLEEVLASSRRKCKGLEAELQKLRELKFTELSNECEKCRHWRTNKRDQSTQCLPKSAPIYLSGMSSGIIEDHIKMTKLAKDKETLKNLCRGRQKQILELESKLKELEKELTKKSSNNDEKVDVTGVSSLTTSTKSDSTINSRQAMKENVPAIWENQKHSTHVRRDWFR